MRIVAFMVVFRERLMMEMPWLSKCEWTQEGREKTIFGK